MRQCVHGRLPRAAISLRDKHYKASNFSWADRMSISAIQAVRGMNDVLPEAGKHWDFVESTVVACLRQYGYRCIRMPLVEPTELFVRSIGEVTDIVEKEMYTFIDRLNGDSLTLRPEGTASCVRATIQHKTPCHAPI